MKEINRRTARTGDCGGSLSRQLRPCTCESAKTCRRMVQVGWRNCPRRLTAGLARVCRQPPSREKEWIWPACALEHHVFADRKKALPLPTPCAISYWCTYTHLFGTCLSSSVRKLFRIQSQFYIGLLSACQQPGSSQEVCLTCTLQL